ncbi:MAG: hypothetical protein H0X40_02230 [Chthoniobacterales bacterium]|nr:hypothetical protein [Chthoniobacterales bacterium]
MDSINQNQPEDNRADLSANEAVAKIKELVESADLFFSTTAKSSESDDSIEGKLAVS